MSFTGYDSEKGAVSIHCPRCDTETNYRVDTLVAYAGPEEEGVYLRTPNCPKCPSTTILFTGKGIGSKGGHTLNCLAQAVVSLGKIVNDPELPVSGEVKTRLDQLRLKYADDPRVKEFDGNAPISWRRKGK